MNNDFTAILMLMLGMFWSFVFIFESISREPFFSKGIIRLATIALFGWAFLFLYALVEM